MMIAKKITIQRRVPFYDIISILNRAMSSIDYIQNSSVCTRCWEIYGGVHTW
jgi:hypothetical protein